MIQQNSSLIADEQISEKLQIYISGRNLVYQNSTPSSYIVVELTEFGGATKQVLQTKVHNLQKNPNYSQTLIIDFIFEVKQKLTFYVFQEGAKLIGKMETSVGEIFGSPINGLIRSVKNQKDQQNGKLVLRCQKVEKGKRRTFSAQITAKSLPNLKWWFFFGGTSPFFRIFRIRQTDQLLLYESEVLNYTTNPQWKPFKLSQQKLCKLTESMELEIRVYNFIASGNHTLIGTTQFSLNKLGIRKNFKILPENQNKGEIVFKEVKRTIKYEFGNFIQKGLQLALTTCIDFTASNGNPQSQSSLHFGTLSKKSQYEEAMSQVLNILLDYDYDKLVPCYGFGAQVNHPKFSTKGKVHHCFPLNGNQSNPCIYQKSDIIKTYRTIFPYLKLSGPTKFSQLLKQSILTCKEFQNNVQKTEYMILFILTDGEIHDRAEVFDLLIQCNRLPMSIIIVGVGDGDFTIMHQLDDDDCSMTDSQGNKTQRDLVQFVEFKKFKNNGAELAKQVLYELPRQVQEYFELVGIQPDNIIQKFGDIEEQILLDLSQMKEEI